MLKDYILVVCCYFSSPDGHVSVRFRFSLGSVAFHGRRYPLPKLTVPCRVTGLPPSPTAAPDNEQPSPSELGLGNPDIGKRTMKSTEDASVIFTVIIF